MNKQTLLKKKITSFRKKHLIKQGTIARSQRPSWCLECHSPGNPCLVMQNHFLLDIPSTLIMKIHFFPAPSPPYVAIIICEPPFTNPNKGTSWALLMIAKSWYFQMSLPPEAPTAPPPRRCGARSPCQTPLPCRQRAHLQDCPCSPSSRTPLHIIMASSCCHLGSLSEKPDCFTEVANWKQVFSFKNSSPRPIFWGERQVNSNMGMFIRAKFY